MVETILVPTDGSEHADKAVAFAADIAVKYGAGIILLHVLSDPGSGRVPDEMRELGRLEHIRITEHDIRQAHIRITEHDIRQAGANELLHNADTKAREHGATEIEQVIEVGDPTRHILACAEARGADLIVMGSRGLGDLRGLLLGSVSHKIGHLAKCTCITVR
jgi:nucleotide-binding universal stress UspA family protein